MPWKNEAVKNQNFELAADYRDQEANLQEELNRIKAAWEEKLSRERVTVDEDQIAEVVSMMTGIPVQRMGEAEGHKLKDMAVNLKRGSHRTGRGHRQVGALHPARPRGTERPEQAHRSVHVPRPYGSGQDVLG